MDDSKRSGPPLSVPLGFRARGRHFGQIAFVAATLGATAACSSGDSPTAAADGAVSGAVPEEASSEAGLLTCAHDPRVQTYVPGMQVAGSGGALTFVLTAADPSPPARGVNAWTIAVRDTSGQQIASPSYTLVKPWMPDHGHGPSLVPAATPNADGTDTIGNLDFFMAGVWQVTLQVHAGVASDTGVFTFCVP